MRGSIPLTLVRDNTKLDGLSPRERGWRNGADWTRCGGIFNQNPSSNGKAASSSEGGCCGLSKSVSVSEFSSEGYRDTPRGSAEREPKTDNCCRGSRKERAANCIPLKECRPSARKPDCCISKAAPVRLPSGRPQCKADGAADTCRPSAPSSRCCGYRTHPAG